MEEIKKLYRESPRVRPLIKTEYAYVNEDDTDPQITTKETPYSATELAKIKKDYGCLPRESGTEYVWRISLTGGDQIQLSEKEASGYLGHGVCLTTGDSSSPWSLTQCAAYWAGGFNPLERGDPLAIIGTADQLLESVHKAACLQMIQERILTPRYESPVMLLVDPEIMTPLIRGLPESLKPMGISLQRTIATMGPIERLESFLNSSRNDAGNTMDLASTGYLTPAQAGNRFNYKPKVWTWGEVAQELIDYSRKYCLVKTPEEKSRGIRQVGIKNLINNPNKIAVVARDRSHYKTSLTHLHWWCLGLKKGIPKNIMNGLPLDKLSMLVTHWHIPK